LLVADLGGSHGLLVTSAEGRILFARSITHTEDGSDTRLEKEISRTLHFSQQRLGLAIHRVIALGSRCHAALSGRTIRQGLAIQSLLVNLEIGGFAEQALHLSPQAIFNFAHTHQRPPAWVQTSLTAATAVVLAGALAIAAAVELKRHRQAVEEMGRVELATERDGQQLEARHLRALARTLDRQGPDVATALVQHLPLAVPAGLRLTTVELVNATNHWAVHVEGVTREQGSGFLTLVEQLEAELSRSVLKLQVSDSTHRRTFLGSSAPPAPRPALPSQPLGSREERPFFLSGIIE
jgi:hypothetical protein